MKNYVTGYEYTGHNAAILSATGVDSVVTFRQALSIPGVSGKTMKGLKAIATLVRFSKKETVEDENGVAKPKPIYFSVFDVAAILARKAV